MTEVLTIRKTGYTAAPPILYALFRIFTATAIGKRRIASYKVPLSPHAASVLKKVFHKILHRNRLTTKKSSIKQQIKITFPQNNSKVKATDEGYVNVIIEGGIAPYTLYVDGIEQENAFSFKVTESGFYDLCAIDNDGDESLITIQVFT